MPVYSESPNYESLAEALYSYTVDTLRPLTKFVCDKTPSRKGDMVAAICRTMLSDKLKFHFGRLSDIEKAAVQEAIFSPEGELNLIKFKAKHQQEAPIGRSLGWRSNGYLVDLFIVNRHVPDDLGNLLIEFIKKPEKDRIKYADKLPKSIRLGINEKTVDQKLLVRNTASAAINNLQTVLRLVEGDKIKVGAKTGRPTLAAQKNLARLLQEGDWYEADDILGGIGHIQAFAWPMLLQGVGLAKADGSTLKLTNKGKKALRGNFPQIIKDAWDRWYASKFLDEFSRVDRIKGQKASRGRALFAVQTRRPVLYDGLTLCTPGKWLKVKELIRAMNSEGFDFEVARNAWKLYIGNSQSGYLNEYEDLRMIEKRYLLVFLFEYAATLGIIDVAYIHPDGALSDHPYQWGWGMDDVTFLSRYDGLMYIRLNSLGAFAMEMTDIYETEPTEARAVFTVLPNHDVVVTDAQALSPADKLFLEKTCQKQSSALWVLTTRTLLEAAQNGTRIEEIKTFLKSRSAQPIPKTVTTLLTDVKKRSTGLEYAGRTHLVACKDTVLQKLVASDTKLSKLCLPTGKKHLVIMPGKEKQFITALVHLGYIVPQLREQI
ncbi:MAG: helicase-associated domain-containing protein [Deltaproteobacteria bacterium]|nr:helicase-associated domain-containing protein [Deltaproteobacteria bacterium]